ncbi:class I lanthipeptide [Chitinophaga flava]|uniref:class I lanthipeptide n=1 Tax=Chitinophaga flava TaxID=2259036 RepID=UPI0011BEC608|nr:class I lanthipeptide [Chitinophaga flava]
MKKKQVSLQKKLSFAKVSVAPLNAGQQQQIAGGQMAQTSPAYCRSYTPTCDTVQVFTGPC